MMDNNIGKYLSFVAKALNDNVLVKMTLSKPARKNDELRNLYVKPVLIKGARLFAFTYRYERRDEVKNYDAAQMLELLGEMLPERFLNAALFTVNEDIALLVSAKGKATIQTKRVQEIREPNFDHDKQKQRLVNPANPWWFLLGLTTREGKVLADMQHKYKQICKYVEIVDGVMKNVSFDDEIHIADMGAGKGYLTFALYEYLTSRSDKRIVMEGVEIRPDLVMKINDVIEKCGLKDFRFVEHSIDDYKPEQLDVLIALHACDTATDDAILKGIRNNAKLIVCAPCCHKQIRQEMEKSGQTDPITRFGIFLERQAVMLTDAVRALVMEYCGYKTQVMEFIELENTPKNVLLVGRKSDAPVDKASISRQINGLLSQYGIDVHYLWKRLFVNLKH